MRPYRADGILFASLSALFIVGPACSSGGGTQASVDSAIPIPPIATGGIMNTPSDTGGHPGSGGWSSSGGIVGSGGVVHVDAGATDSVLATGGIPPTDTGVEITDGVLATGGRIVDAAGTLDCQCGGGTGSGFEIPWECYCAIRDCGVTLSQYRPGGDLAALFWGLEEFAGCNRAIVTTTTLQMDTRQVFDLTTGQMIGESEVRNAGVACPFGGDAAGPTYSLSAGQVDNRGCVRTACVNGANFNSFCGI